MKKVSLLFISLVLAGSMLCSGCKNDIKPENVMEPSIMVDFLTEAYMLEGFFAIESNYRYAEMSKETEQAYAQLLDSFNITKEDFEASILYYSEHADQYQDIHAQVMTRLESME